MLFTKQYNYFGAKVISLVSSLERLALTNITGFFNRTRFYSTIVRWKSWRVGNYLDLSDKTLVVSEMHKKNDSQSSDVFVIETSF